MKKFTLLFVFITLLIINSSIAQNGWYPQTSGTTNSLIGVFFTDVNNGWVVGAGGTILHTTNSGTNWVAQNVFGGITNSLYAVSFTDANTGSAAGSGGIILRTTNGGNTWSYNLLGAGYAFTGVYFSDVNHGTAINAGSLIFNTTNGGTTWTNQFTGQRTNLAGMSFSDANHGWIVGDVDAISGLTQHTTDGGITWGGLSGGASLLSAVSFADSNNGTSVGVFGTIRHTTNGGSTWINQTIVTNIDFYGVNVTDINNGTVVGHSGTIYRTTNGGTTWVAQTSGTTNNLIGVCFIGANYGWAVGNGGTILHTINGGVPVELVSFTTSVNGNSVMLNWKTATEINNKGFEVQKNINNNWTDLAFVNGNGTTTEAKAYSYIDNNASSGKIVYRLKQIDFNGSSKYSNEVEVNIAPTEFALSQNYPNPFNPSTAISYRIAAPLNLPQGETSTKVELNIYDVLGQKVVTLVNKEQQAGNYKVEFNASALPSGIYFYQLKAGNFVETKKMVLMK